MTREKSKKEIKIAAQVNEGIRELSHKMWRRVDQRNFKSFKQFDQMFWMVTNRAWLQVEQTTFKNKLEFAKLYWEDYYNRNLRK